MKKLTTIKKLEKILATLKKQGKTIGLCIGGYDLVHPGHIANLEAAKKLCDVLVVGVTADKFIKKRKGKGRPIYTDKQRAYILSQLIATDFAFPCPYETAAEAIELLKPDMFIRGPDYAKRTVIVEIPREQKAFKKTGCQLKYTNAPSMSTTAILRRIKETT